MMKIIYFVVAGVVMLSGLGGAIYFGIQPKTIPKINLSHFDQAEQVGHAVTQRLRLELQSAPILLIGVWPGKQEDISMVKGLLANLTEPGFKYDTVVVEPKLPMIEQIEGEQIDLRDDLTRFADGAKKALAEGRRVVAVIPSSYSSQLIQLNPADRLKKEFGLDVTSISLAPFPHTREDEKDFEVKCDSNIEDRTGAAPFGCAVLHKARTIYRKKKDKTKFSALLDQTGGRDYLMLITPPSATN